MLMLETTTMIPRKSKQASDPVQMLEERYD
jgi:hypothetical protein